MPDAYDKENIVSNVCPVSMTSLFEDIGNTQLLKICIFESIQYPLNKNRIGASLNILIAFLVRVSSRDGGNW